MCVLVCVCMCVYMYVYVQMYIFESYLSPAFAPTPLTPFLLPAEEGREGGRLTACHAVPLSNPHPPTELLPLTVRSTVLLGAGHEAPTPECPLLTLPLPVPLLSRLFAAPLFNCVDVVLTLLLVPQAPPPPRCTYGDSKANGIEGVRVLDGVCGVCDDDF